MRKFDYISFRITGKSHVKKKLTSVVSKSVWGNPAMKVSKTRNRQLSISSSTFKNTQICRPRRNLPVNSMKEFLSDGISRCLEPLTRSFYQAPFLKFIQFIYYRKFYRPLHRLTVTRSAYLTRIHTSTRPPHTHTHLQISIDLQQVYKYIKRGRLTWCYFFYKRQIVMVPPPPPKKTMLIIIIIILYDDD